MALLKSRVILSIPGPFTIFMILRLQCRDGKNGNGLYFESRLHRRTWSEQADR